MGETELYGKCASGQRPDSTFLHFLGVPWNGKSGIFGDRMALWTCLEALLFQFALTVCSRIAKHFKLSLAGK